MSAELVLIGAGPMAVAYAKALRVLGVKFAVIGRGPDSAARFERETGIRPATGELNAQLATLGGVPRRAIVAVGILDLPSVAKELLVNGTEWILLEKPGAVDSVTMRKLASSDPKGHIKVAYNRRFLPSVVAARRAIAEDGGVLSFQFEFCENAERVSQTSHPALVKQNWALANSSHVIDLAFHLAGTDERLTSVSLMGTVAAGEVSWHPAGARFAGCGIVATDIPFAFTADWESGGGWAVEICTPVRRLRLRPLEMLTEQRRGQFAIETVSLTAESSELKPGLSGMLTNFLENEGAGLPSAAEQACRISMFERIAYSKGKTRPI